MKTRHFLYLLISVSILLPGNEVHADEAWYVLMHEYGPGWDQTAGEANQAGIERHHAYLAACLEAGSLVLAGPFSDESGGLVILDVESLAEAEEIANQDPAVQSGMLKVEIKRWLTPLSSVFVTRKRSPVINIPKDSPFKVKSPPLQAPIQIED